MLLSGSDDKSVCLWDINAGPKSGPSGTTTTLKATTTFHGHSDIVEDVAWHWHHEVSCLHE